MRKFDTVRVVGPVGKCRFTARRRKLNLGEDKMKGIDRRHLAGLLVLVLIAFAGAAPAQQAPERSIIKITGDLYRFQNRFHYSVFLVTPAGIIATDPINADAARWLKGEIAKRFGLPVKYLILSHDHADHSSGGEVFADTALVIAHENAKKTIIGEKRPTAVPNITFSDRMTIELGGKRVELIYVGRNHSDNSIVMRFPAARALFAVDFVPVKTLAFRRLAGFFEHAPLDASVLNFDFRARKLIECLE